MNPANALPFALLHPVQYLKEELAPYPGRLNLVLRVLLSSAIVIVVSQTLEVPLLVLSVIMVMAVTQSNLLVSRLVGVVIVLAMTISIGTTILTIKYTYDYPLLRILVVSVLFFASMFMMRATKIGRIFWFMAIFVSFGQTFVDQTDHAELVVRALLWLWVSMVYPVPVALVINTIFMPVEPEKQLKKSIHQQLQAIDAHLAFLPGSPGKPAPITLQSVQKGALTLQTLLKLTTMRNKAYKAEKSRHLAVIATVSRLYAAAGMLPQEELVSPDPKLVDSLNDLRKACAALDSAIASDQPFSLPEPLASNEQYIRNAPIKEMQTALEALAGYEANPLPPPPAQSVKKSLFVEDAFTNPVYVQFALKTLLAVMGSWVFYSAVDWGGIHTIMVTCVIVAQSSAGASAQKSWLRIAGAGFGSLLALFMIVFVIPQIDTIVGALMMILPVIAISSWIMIGSERISYIGLQTVMTFGLALLMDFGPSTNLTEVRDRLIGVLLGVIVSTVIHSLIWPESEGRSARYSLADLLQTIGKWLKPTHKEITPANLVAESQEQLAVVSKLAACESMLARVALEPSGRESQHEELNLFLHTLLIQARSIMLAVKTLKSELDMHLKDLPVNVRDAVFSIQEQAAASLDRYAKDLQDDVCQSPAPIPLDALERSFEISSTAVSETHKSAILNSAENLVRHLAMLPARGASEPTLTNNLDMVQSYA